MSPTPLAIAIDVGGTSARVALVAAPGRLLEISSIPTGRRLAVDDCLRQVVAAVRRLQAQAAARRASVIGVGVGVPGLVDSRRGIVHYLVNMPRWHEVPVRRVLEQATRLATVVENDVNAMTWGEFCWGAGRGVQSLVCLALGTGVGGGIVIDGRLYRGWTMSAGEIGHIPLAIDGPRCACGGRACLERYVGNRAIVALARRLVARRRRGALYRLVHGRLHRLTPPLIDQAAHRGDPVAKAVWREVGTRLGVALTAVVNVLNPERIVIGGGIAKAGPLLFPTIRATIRARAMRGPSAVSVVPARWGEHAGLIGAAALLFVPDRPRRR